MESTQIEKLEIKKLNPKDPHNEQIWKLFVQTNRTLVSVPSIKRSFVTRLDVSPFSNCQVSTLGGFQYVLCEAIVSKQYSTELGYKQFLDDFFISLYQNPEGCKTTILVDINQNYSEEFVPYLKSRNCLIFQQNYQNFNNSKMSMVMFNVYLLTKYIQEKSTE